MMVNDNNFHCYNHITSERCRKMGTYNAAKFNSLLVFKYCGII